MSLLKSLRGYTLAQTAYQAKRLSKAIPWIVGISIIGALFFGRLVIELNLSGHRDWIVFLGLVPAMVLVMVLFRPGILAFLGGFGILDKLSDGVPNTPRQVLTGGIDEFEKLANILGHIALFLQTFCAVAALARFENALYAYAAASALPALGLCTILFSVRAKVYVTIMWTFWTLAFVVPLFLAFVYPDYYQDELGYELRHAEAEGERSRRADAGLPLVERLRNGETLSVADREAAQRIHNQEASNGVLDVLDPECAQKTVRWNGQASQTIVLGNCTVGRYTFSASSNAPNDAMVNIATVAYLNGEPPTGQHPINIGPSGQVSLTIRLDPADVTREAQWARDITFTFRPE